MALVFPPTQDPVEIKAIQLIRAIEATNPIYQSAATYTWFRVLMDNAVRPGADRAVMRCALRLIVTYLPITTPALIWTLFVFLTCTVPSSWGISVRAAYQHLEPSLANLYVAATKAPQATPDQLAQLTRDLFNRFMMLPAPSVSLTLTDLAPVRSGYVALRDYLTGQA